MNISIAMATYNGEKYLKEQLDSLMKQTVYPLELVICDDGSSDNTIDIIKNFANLAPFKVYLYENKINLGYSDNFFKAASFCKGTWIAFCDQDDVWFPNKLEKITEIIAKKESDNILLISHSGENVTENLHPIGQKTPNFRKSEIIQKNKHYGFWVLPGFSCIVHRKLIFEFDWMKRPRDFNSGNKQAHDVWICMLTNSLGDMYTIKEPLVYWRRHNTATTLSISDMKASSLKAKIKNSQNFGRELYNFRAVIAKESSDTMKQLAFDHKENNTIYNDLIKGSLLFEKLSKNLFAREKLYVAKSTFAKLRCFLSIFLNGAYFGNRFYTFGWKSLLKDFYHVFS